MKHTPAVELLGVLGLLLVIGGGEADGDINNLGHGVDNRVARAGRVKKERKKD